jgi:hypothetical protein
MTTPILPVALDGLPLLSLATAHAAGATTFALASGSGALVAARASRQGVAVSPSSPCFVFAVPNANVANGQVISFPGCIEYAVTGLSGDTLTGVSLLYPGTTIDPGFSVGDYILFGTLAEHMNAVSALAIANAAALAGKAPLASPALTGPATLNGSPLASQAWVQAQGYSTSGAGSSGHGPLWFNALNYGALGDNATDNSPLLQAAVDHIISVLPNGGSSKAALFLPGSLSSYDLGYPVWVDCSNVEVVGEGDGSTQIQSVSKMPAFIFGVARSQQVDALGTMSTLAGDATYRPDCHGKLDASAAATAGVRWGLRTNAKAVFQFHGSPLSAGVGSSLGTQYSDQWTETSKLTVEFCVEAPDGQQLPMSFGLLGSGTYPDDPAPFVVGVGASNHLMIRFQTADKTLRSFKVDLTGHAAPYKVAFQMDLDNYVFTGFVNGTQVAIIEPENLSAGSSGLKFILNDHYPFMVGISGMLSTFGGVTGLDLRCYGLRLSNTIRYQNNGATTTQTRADSPGTALNDAWAYFGNDSHTIAFLSGTDNPATSTANTARVISVTNGGATSGGTTMGLIVNTMASAPTQYKGNAVRNLTIEGSGAYGQLVCVGGVFDMTFENVTITNGYHGIGSFAIASSYYVNLLGDVFLAGSDAGYFGAIQQVVNAGRIEFTSSGRVCARFAGCNANWKNVFVGGHSPTCEGIVKARDLGYGGNYTFENVEIDFEGFNISGAGFHVDATRNCAAPSLVLRDIFFGTVGAAACLVRLRDTGHAGGSLARGYVAIDNLQAQTSTYTSAVEIDGPLWRGYVSGGAITGTQLVNLQTWGSATNVVFVYQ